MELLDKIYVISVREAHERRKKITKAMDGLNRDLEFYIVDRDTNPTRGCYNSHHGVVKLAKEKGYKHILIFEDDASPIVGWDTIKTTIKNFFKSPPKDWKYCLLGYLPVRSERVGDCLYMLKCAYDLHAYLVNVGSVGVNDVWDGKYCDSLLCKNLSPHELFTRPDLVIGGDYNKGIYGVYPMLFKQDSQESYINDISLTQKYFFEFFGGYDNSIIVSSYTNSIYLGIFIIINAILATIVLVTRNNTLLKYYIGFVVMFILILLCDYCIN